MNSFIIWITGKSKTGKSTIAKKLNEFFSVKNLNSYILEGKYTLELFKDIGFEIKNIRERIRRLGILSFILADAGIIPIIPSVSPIKDERERIKNSSIFPFIEVYLKCPEEIREKRLTKLSSFTEYVNKIYVPPENPDIEIDTHIHNVEKSVKIIIEYLIINKYII
ncbi:adenylyl-sulfate kinase [Thermosipho atlanticus]|uniref:Adenylylsulfate kinase n=1 Tax=Thermosipho atlanticus DSM 15807 TaxID=1123380 RepID=A0A1M5RYG1_9BACT|nr:adenylyl-sulfate kinase [Thermosipho atlanticus]SHH31392.1 adenylylsulfate kinase [Thermosipho atlanticus DSM 15807]